MFGYDIPGRVAALLRSAEGGSLPLSRVHVALVAEGGGFGSYAQLRNELARRSDLFLLLEPRHPLADNGAWPGDVRGEYEAALVGAGIDSGLRVALAPRPRESTHPVVYVEDRAVQDAPWDDGDVEDDPLMLRQLDASLIQLWGAAGGDAVLRADLAEAMSQTEDLRRVLGRGIRGRP